MRRFALLVLLLLFPTAVMAQNNATKTKAAVIDPAKAAADFGYQGEYAGWCWDARRGWVWCGLQVVALGDQKFDAVLYDGGLPGNGWNQRTPEKASGQRGGDSLELRGPQRAIVSDHYSATVFNSAGQRVGQLQRMLRESPTLAASPPPGATVLFPMRSTPADATGEAGDDSASQLSRAKLADDGTLLAGVLTKMPVEAFYMHLEFRTPYMPHARGQGRGNSGVYIQQRYEVQILDSFGLEGLDNECGGLYKQARPAANLCLPPLAWQTYDIWFTPPRFAADGKTKLSHALITVLHNGVPIHSYRQVTAKTGGGKQEGPEPFPINLQDHGNPVTFRNIWLVPGDGHFATSSPRRRFFSRLAGERRGRE